MQPESVVAIITEEIQSDAVAALHAAGIGHLARVIRRERGAVADQLERAGIATAALPRQVQAAERVVLITPAPRGLETACLMLQRGATSAWTVSGQSGWQAIDDEMIAIAATRELPPRPAPPHRADRTFRQRHIRRRPRRQIRAPGTSRDSSSSSHS